MISLYGCSVSIIIIILLGAESLGARGFFFCVMWCVCVCVCVYCL